MKTLLVVTETLPEDFSKANQGIVQRLRLFIDGLAGHADRLQVLFMARPPKAVGADAQAWAQDGIRKHWHQQADVDFCFAPPPAESHSFWSHYVAPAVSAQRNGVSGRLCRPEHLQGLRQALARKPAAILAHRLPSMYALTVAARGKLPKVYFDLDDVEHLRFLRTVPTLPYGRGKYLMLPQTAAIHWAERRAAAAATRTFVCSERDRTYLQGRLGLPRIEVIPNAVNVPDQPAYGVPEQTVLFVGVLNYEPNLHGAQWLIRDVWPLVRRAVPDARLLIVGDGEARIAADVAGADGVTAPGFVPDLDAVYRRSGVVCCPIRVGSGTRIKLIEAAGYGKAMVSTTIGAEGLAFEDGRHALIRDDATSFAGGIVELLRDPGRSESLGAAARQLAVGGYARQSVIERIDVTCGF